MSDENSGTGEAAGDRKRTDRTDRTDRPVDERRVQRNEEQLEAGTRKREAGEVRVRKSVRTDREQYRVPKRREEVEIQRVPVGEDAPGAELGEQEVVLQVFEEEVVISKKVVLKEEIRLRKEVVEDEEIVEEDVRREEVEIDDQTGRRGASGA